jgi:hypothetical protein
MPAPLLPLLWTTDDADSRRKQYREEFFEAWGDAEQDLATERVYQAAKRYQDFLENRTKSLERTIRLFLASSSLTEAQRADLLAALYGTQKAIECNPKLLNTIERGLIELYRRMDNRGRQMIAVLFERLFASSSSNGHDPQGDA